jgi:hypothetical protein
LENRLPLFAGGKRKRARAHNESACVDQSGCAQIHAHLPAQRVRVRVPRTVAGCDRDGSAERDVDYGSVHLRLLIRSNGDPQTRKFRSEFDLAGQA